MPPTCFPLWQPGHFRAACVFGAYSGQQEFEDGRVERDNERAGLMPPGAGFLLERDHPDTIADGRCHLISRYLDCRQKVGILNA